jgi:hypothetical protein
MSLSQEHLRTVVDGIFKEYDLNRNSQLELTEVAKMINRTLRKGSISQLCTIHDARDFIEIADSNHDHKLSREELFGLFKKILS